MTDTGPRLKIIPAGDTKERKVCPECQFIAYENPKVVANVLATWQGKFLLCRRGIQPGKGLWGLPGGFLENGETIKEGAAREAREEAHADIEVGSLLGVYELTALSQILTVFRGELKSPHVEAGEETLEVGLFAWEDIPWDELAFPVVAMALHQYKAMENVPDRQLAPEFARLFLPPRPPASPPPPAPPKL